MYQINNYLARNWSAITMVLSFVGISLPQLFPNLCKQIKEISKWISPITLIVSFIIIVSNIDLSIIKVRNENLDESVSKITKDIGNILEKESRKLIIIMDDIDRLSSQSINRLACPLPPSPRGTTPKTR